MRAHHPPQGREDSIVTNGEAVTGTSDEVASSLEHVQAQDRERSEQAERLSASGLR